MAHNTLNPHQNAEIFDFKAFRSRMLDDEEMIRYLISSILKRMPGMVDALGKMLEQEDMRLIRRQAHTIKGAAANVKCELFRKAALNIELAAQSERIERIREMVPSLVEEWERLKPILQHAIL